MFVCACVGCFLFVTECIWKCWLFISMFIIKITNYEIHNIGMYIFVSFIGKSLLEWLLEVFPILITLFFQLLQGISSSSVFIALPDHILWTTVKIFPVSLKILIDSQTIINILSMSLQGPISRSKQNRSLVTESPRGNVHREMHSIVCDSKVNASENNTTVFTH